MPPQTQSSVKQFYESFPYPSKSIDSIENLYKNSEWITSLIGFKPDSFPSGSKILEAGCGTGEFSCGFALSEKAKVIGIDISGASLKKAKINAKKFKLNNLEFMEANVLFLPFDDSSFDFVFSLGCIHHTESPEQAFAELARVLKPEGFIVLGVYNKFGRMKTIFRKLFLDFLCFLLRKKSSEEKISLANKLFYSGKPLDEKKRIWIADKYLHPLENFYSIGELTQWFEIEEIELINALPKFDFKNKSVLNHFFVELDWLLNEKSFFIFAGKKRAGK